ncbi:MAG: ferrous iron transport protein B [Deltaproteobacteria bacterium]|nr:ferrous iron transport protein B [Candidatus Zymogenaceae bacterium]
MAHEITVALAGNPNAGKTTIFNRLTGSRQKVGNWGGVTVDKKEGTVNFKGYTIHLIDLPGTYSLTAYSIEEIIARNYILNQKPDVVINVVDASNLDRNLYLTTQLIELDTKLVLAFSMMDIAHDAGLIIDTDHLSELFNARIVPLVGTTGKGLDDLLQAVVDTAHQTEPSRRHIEVRHVKEIEQQLETIQSVLEKDAAFSATHPSRWTALKLLEEDPEIQTLVRESTFTATEALDLAAAAKQLTESLFDDDPSGLIVDRRYGFVAGAVRESVRRETMPRIDITRRIDSILVHRLLGFPILFFSIWLMFQLTFTVGHYPTRLIALGVDWLGNFLRTALPAGVFSNLLADGIVPGVGGVAVFVPNIFILYFIISIFEDSGYMARAAFIMDKVMHKLGLHGKSFIPMIMGFGCNVPAIAATRTLKSKQDRIITILINPLVSCSARLPVYILLAGTFFPRHAGNVIFSIYLLGIALAFVIGRLFKKTIFRSDNPPFVMELPPYRLPTLRGTLIHMWEQGSLFLKKMTTVILLGAVVIWFLSTYPAAPDRGNPPTPTKTTAVETITVRDSSTAPPSPSDGTVSNGDVRPNSMTYLEKIGFSIEPIFVPLGFPWQASVALLSGFVAKEIVVSTFGVLYGVGEEKSIGKAMIRGGWTPAAAYAFMVFVLLYTPCLATIAAIKKETSPTIASFSVGYSLVLAWIVSFIAYRIGILAGLG